MRRNAMLAVLSTADTVHLGHRLTGHSAARLVLASVDTGVPVSRRQLIPAAMGSTTPIRLMQANESNST